MSLSPGSSTGHLRDTSRSRQVSAQHRPSLRQVTSLSISTRWHPHGYRAGWCCVVTCDAPPATPCHPGTAGIARSAVGNRHCGLRSWARAVRARSTAAGKPQSTTRAVSSIHRAHRAGRRLTKTSRNWPSSPSRRSWMARTSVSRWLWSLTKSTRSSPHSVTTSVPSWLIGLPW